MLGGYSTMETPYGLVITDPKNKKSITANNYNQGVVRSAKIPCFVFDGDKLFRFPSIGESTEKIGVRLNGKSFRTLKANKYHILRNKMIIYIDFESLPENIKEKVNAISST